MKYWKIIVKITAFLMLFALIFFPIATTFHVNGSYIPGMLKSLNKAKAGSLDAIIIGSSVVYTYWVPTAAWDSRGYAIQPLSITLMPGKSILPFVREQRKKHPDSLYIINLGSFRTDKITENGMHCLLDFLPLGETKLELMKRLADEPVLKGHEAEYLLPFLRFHPAWQDIKVLDISRSYTDTKGSLGLSYWKNDVYDISDLYSVVTETVSMEPEIEENLNELLTYLRDEKVNAMFVTVPWGMEKEEKMRMNSTVDAVEAAGFPVLDLMNEAESMGMDLEHDYMDNKHANIHGALLFTRTLCEYLDEHYDFEDKRNDPSYEDWNIAAQEYRKFALDEAVPVEWALRGRDNDLDVPELQSLTADENGVTLRWGSVEGADQYRVYSRKKGGNWRKGVVLDGDVTEYVDANAVPGETRIYTVVAGRKQDGEFFFSRYNHDGWPISIPK